MTAKVQGLIEPLRAAIEASGLTSYMLGKEAGISPISIDRFKRGERGLSLETADKIARVLNAGLEVHGQPTVRQPIQWRNSHRDPATWVLEIGGQVAAEVQQLDSGEWRWQRFGSIAEHGMPPAAGRAASRRDAQKKAWPQKLEA